MASSWKETGHPPPHRDEEDHDQEEEQDHNYDDLDKKEAGDEEWLQLGLGINCSRRRSSSTSMIISTTSNSSSSSRLISCWKAPQDHRHHHHQDHDDHDHEIFVDSSNQNAPNFINMIMVSSTTHQTTHDHHHMGPSNYPASINNISSTVHHDHGHAADAAAAASGSGSGSFLFGGVHHEHYCHDSQMNMAVPAVITTTPPPPPNSISLRSSSSSSTTTRATPSSTGLWFTLRSSLNRELGEKGQALPQIPKAYIRVKDENVTIFMVKKYLVRKLGLSNEAEIDIWCMGQNLMHTQTLKQVRDGVWLPRLVESVNSAAAAASGAASFDDDDADQQQHLPLTFSNHLMSLHYGRRYIFN